MLITSDLRLDLHKFSVPNDLSLHFGVVSVGHWVPLSDLPVWWEKAKPACLSQMPRRCEPIFRPGVKIAGQDWRKSQGMDKDVDKNESIVVSAKS